LQQAFAAVNLRMEGFAKEQTMARFLCLILWCFSGIASAAEPSFTPLPDLPGGAVGTFVTALSANGEVAVGMSGSNLNPAFPHSAYPFRWTKDTGMVALGELPGAANGVSADGSVVVGRVSVPGKPNPSGAFRWTAGAGIVLLQGLSETSPDFAYSVSDDGRTVAGRSDNRAVRWVDGQVLDLGAGTNTLPVYISADGSVAAGTATANLVTEAWRWSAADGVASLERLPGHTSSSVSDMTPDGRVIIGGSGAGTVGSGLRWTTDAGVTAFSFGTRAVSDDGRVIVGMSARPILWTEGTGAVELQPFLTGLGLDLTGWTLTDVRAISGDGKTIAGHGIPPDPSMSGAWIATIPEPSTWLLGGIALSVAALGVRLRRRRSLCAARRAIESPNPSVSMTAVHSVPNI
jgi:uncharacterized membrane protein